MQKATRAWGLGTSPLSPPLQRSDRLIQNAAEKAILPNWAWRQRAPSSPFCFSSLPTELQHSVPVESLKKEGMGLGGPRRRGGMEKGGLCLVWSGLSPSPAEGSSSTWKPPNLKYKWDPLGSQNSSLHSCTASIYSTASLQPQAPSEMTLLRSVPMNGTPASMSFENRIVHKGPFMVLSLFFRTHPNPERL